MGQSELCEEMHFSGCFHGIEPNIHVIRIDLENGIFLWKALFSLLFFFFYGGRVSRGLTLAV